MNQSKVVLITGAGKRIGAEMARFLHAKGLNIIVHYRDSEKEAQYLCREFNDTRANSAIKIQADLNDTAHIEKMVLDTANHWGRLDVLINNASSFFPTPLGKVSEEAWHDLIGSNVKGPLFLAQATMPFLKKHQGCIINISDIHGQKPLKNYAVYSVAKAGLIMLTKALALELGPEIRVNSIAPGPTLWPTGDNELESEKKQKIIDKNCLKKPGTPLNISKMAYFLIEEDNHMTGQVLNIDGGSFLGFSKVFYQD